MLLHFLPSSAGPARVLRAVVVLSAVGIGTLTTAHSATAATVTTVPTEDWVDNIAADPDGTVRVSGSRRSYDGQPIQLTLGSERSSASRSRSNRCVGPAI